MIGWNVSCTVDNFVWQLGWPWICFMDWTCKMHKEPVHYPHHFAPCDPDIGGAPSNRGQLRSPDAGSVCLCVSQVLSLSSHSLTRGGQNQQGTTCYLICLWGASGRQLSCVHKAGCSHILKVVISDFRTHVMLWLLLRFSLNELSNCSHELQPIKFLGMCIAAQEPVLVEQVRWFEVARLQFI